MTFYQALISKATGLTDPHRIDMVENYMRHIYFHSTLNWQELEVLEKAARESANDLALSGWDFR
jgi:hypothetical protein